MKIKRIGQYYCHNNCKCLWGVLRKCGKEKGKNNDSTSYIKKTLFKILNHIQKLIIVFYFIFNAYSIVCKKKIICDKFDCIESAAKK